VALTSLVLLPLLGSGAVLLLGKGRDGLARQFALAVALVTFVISLVVWWQFNPASADYQFVERHTWLPDFGISYHVGIDGISLLLVVLTTFLTPIALLCSWQSIEQRVREFSFFMLALEAAMIGVFISLDLFLFYLFWDAMLIPMYFLIGIWGYDRRVYASIKFILYTMAGSVLMLVAIIWLAYYHQAAVGVPSFDIVDLYALNVPAPLQVWPFLAFAVAFAIKVPLFPFHTWLPDAHVEAPTAGSVILAGVLLKLGGYGFIRFSLPMFPAASAYFTPLIFALSAIAIIYTSFVALAQTDMKKLIAYSSVAHMGFVTMGLFALTSEAVQGAMIQMLSHGLVSAALFLVVGVVYDRLHTRDIDRYGGLVERMPVYAFVFMCFTLASIGLPGTSGFVGEFLILLGTFRVSTLECFLAATALFLSVMYMLYLYRRVIFGTITREDLRGMTDLSLREKIVFAPLLILVLWMGVYPSSFLVPIRTSVDHLVAQVNAANKNQRQAGLPQPQNAAIDNASASVIPAQAGIQGQAPQLMPWIPAFAGMTKTD
jgi:NADH-quinone oxidoreductase subunit M